MTRKDESAQQSLETSSEALFVRARGIVQGVGFRPFVYRLARQHDLRGWVLNADEGVEIHVEGAPEQLQVFVEDLKIRPPAAAHIARLEVAPAEAQGFDDFSIRESTRRNRPTVRISPDLPV
ncbi:MAG: acylphosphatase, partial [Rhodothermales bacterium]